MTNEESLLQKFDLEAEANRLLANEDEDDLDKINAECEELDQLEKTDREEREGWEYGHGEGLLDAIEALLSYRQDIFSDTLVRVIHKISAKKLIDAPF